jgi:3-oxoadipate enol-lactonase
MLISIMPSKTIHNVTMNYVERGSGLPVVLIHGFPLDSRIWQSQVEALSDRYRVIAPDLPGFGKSQSAGPFSISSLADSVHALLKELGAAPCVLGGLSMGGYVSLAFARKYASDLRGLALIDTRAEADTAAGREGREKMIKLAREKGAKAVADEMFPKMITEQTVQQKPGVAAMLRKIMESQAPVTIEHALAAMRDREDLTQQLPSIAVPTLVIVGEQDAITPPAVAEGMTKSLRNPTLSVIRRAGHVSCMEQPEDVTTTLRRFVEVVNF